MSKPLNAVVDISHHDGNVNLAKAKGMEFWGLFRKLLRGKPSRIPSISAICRRRRAPACSGALTTSGLEAMA